MKKIAVCLTVLTLLLCASAANAQEILSEKRAIGEYTLTVEASYALPSALDVYAYTVTPYEFSADELISLFWPDSDISDVKATQKLSDEGVKLDGKKMIFETYEHMDLYLQLNACWGLYNYHHITEYFTYCSFSRDSKEYVDLHPFANTRELDAILAYIESKLPDAYQLVPMYAAGIRATPEDGKTRLYNLYEYNIQIDGILCDNHSYDLFLVDRRMPYQSVTILASEERVIDVKCFLYDIVKTQEKSRIITPTEAVDGLEQYFSRYITEIDIDIRSISLVYVMMPVRGSMLKYEYVPVWKFMTEDTPWKKVGHKSGDVYYINAFTNQPLDAN